MPVANELIYVLKTLKVKSRKDEYADQLETGEISELSTFEQWHSDVYGSHPIRERRFYTVYKCLLQKTKTASNSIDL